MSLPDLIVPHWTGLDYGVGVDAVSQATKGRVVVPEAQSVHGAGGAASQKFDVSRITSTRELETKLSINVNASGGSPFAGASARFGFSEDSKVQTSSLFMAITCTIKLAGMSIEAPTLTPEATAVLDRQDVFTERYGNMFAHSCDRGGLFVGLLRIETKSEEQSQQISADLKGSYGLFSAEVSTNFSSVEKKYDASVYCSMYSEGGPAFDTHHPDDPVALLDYANAWFKAMHDDPEHNAVPYTWTLAPVTIAAGPLPPNEIDAAHAQDVLHFCARERLILLDQLHLFTYTSENPQRFDWANSVSKDVVAAAGRSAQSDLDVLASCASAAMNHPASAQLPSDYAAAHGTTYPQLAVPDPMPLLTAGAPTPAPLTIDPTRIVTVPSWWTNTRFVDEGYTDADNQVYPSAAQVGVNIEYVRHYTGDSQYEALTLIPPPGSQVPYGSTVTVIVDEEVGP